MPQMECRECGKPPHGGFCYPVLDGLVVALLILTAIGILVALLVWMSV
jgi:hypothetical protein